MPDEAERARALKASFERAAAGAQKNIERAQGEKAEVERQPKDPERSTSAAKKYDPDALSRARSIKKAFDRAASGQQKNIDRTQSEKTKPPPRSHAPAAEPHLRPKGPIREAVDRAIFKEQQQNEHQRAKAINEALKNRQKVQKMLDQNKERDRDRDGRER